MSTTHNTQHTTQPMFEFYHSKVEDLNDRITRLVDFQINSFLYQDLIQDTKNCNFQLYIERTQYTKRIHEISTECIIHFHLQDITTITTTCPFMCTKKKYIPSYFLLHLYNHHLCINEHCTNIFFSRGERRDHIRHHHDAHAPLKCLALACTYKTKNYLKFEMHRFVHHTNHSFAQKRLLVEQQPRPHTYDMSINEFRIFVCPKRGCLGDTLNDFPGLRFSWATRGEWAVHYRDYHQTAYCTHENCHFVANGLLEYVKHTQVNHATIVCQVCQPMDDLNTHLMHPDNDTLDRCSLFPLLRESQILNN